MRRPLLRALGLGAFIALLTAVGGYSFFKFAYAQAAPAASVHEELAGAAADAWLGIVVAPLTEGVARRLNIPQHDGLVVLKLFPDGPAAKAGVQQKDVITALDGAAVKDVAGLKQELQKHTAGDGVRLTVLRAGSTQDIAVTTAAPPARVPPDKGHGERPGLGPLGGFPFLHGLAGGGQNFDNAFGGSFTYKDQNGQVVTVRATFGKIVTASDTSVTIKPNSGEANVAYTIGSGTKLRG